jgi:Family of unknown function (DUF6283)
MTDTRTPVGDPCPSCPYRRDCPSGVWAASEYDRLPGYDGEISDQVTMGAWATFGCHQGDGTVCRGWLGHRDPDELIAVRLAILRGELAPSAILYRTDVPTFRTGAEAAEHGRRDIAAPGDKAREAADKIVRVRRVRGVEVDLG